MLGDPHPASGRHRKRCEQHFDEYNRWRRRRNKAVERGAKQGDWEAEHPYRPKPRSLTSLGSLVVLAPDVDELRTRMQGVLQTKPALDLAHRNRQPFSQKEQGALLDALDPLIIKLTEILRPVAGARP